MNTKKDETYILRWAKKLRAIRLLGGKCTICGNLDRRVLEFHHINNNEKEYGIFYLLDRRWSKIEKELKKCSLVCRNCHSEYHCQGSTRLNNVKAKLLELRKQSKCMECGYVGKNNGSLDFHHRDSEDKDFAIGNAFRFITDMLPKVVDEIWKCDVICKNCHKVKHDDLERYSLLEKEIIRRSFEHKEQKPNISVEEVLKEYKSGRTQKEISLMMACSKSTICKIVKNRDKLGV